MVSGENDGGVEGEENDEVEEADEARREVSAFKSSSSSEDEAEMGASASVQPAPSTTSCVEGTRSRSAASRSAWVYTG